MPEVEKLQISEIRTLLKELDELEIQRNKPDTLFHEREQLDLKIQNVVEKLHDFRDVVGIVLQRTIDLRIHLTQQLGGMHELNKSSGADLTEKIRAQREALRGITPEEKAAPAVKQEKTAVAEPEQEPEVQPQVPRAK